MKLKKTLGKIYSEYLRKNRILLEPYKAQKELDKKLNIERARITKVQYSPVQKIVSKIYRLPSKMRRRKEDKLTYNRWQIFKKIERLKEEKEEWRRLQKKKRWQRKYETKHVERNLEEEHKKKVTEMLNRIKGYRKAWALEFNQQGKVKGKLKVRRKVLILPRVKRYFENKKMRRLTKFNTQISWKQFKQEINKVKTSSKEEKINKYYLHVRDTKNNVFVTLVKEGKIIMNRSGGEGGYKGTRKSSVFGAEMVGKGIGIKLYRRKIRKVIVVMKSRKNIYIKKCLEGLSGSKIKVIAIYNGKVRVHNGMKRKHLRRK
jgi:ribosomal protein S11